MIQRIQSIFLLVVVLSMLASVFFPIWQKQNPKTEEQTTLTFLEFKYEKEKKPVKTEGTYYLAILAGIVIFAATYSIFRFDNRLTQMKIGLFNSLLLSVILVANVYIVTSKGDPSIAEPISGNYGMGFFLPIVAIFANLLANRFIRSDEKLVRSADRMR